MTELNKHFTARTTVLERSATKEIKRLYLNEDDKRDWAVAWSGGKDSTVTLSLLVNMLMELPKKQRKRTVHVVMSDTKVENPILESYMHDQAERLNKTIKENELPITVEVVYRKPEDSFFVLTIGRGYFLPLNNGGGRWCTERLKLKPQNAKLKSINPSLIVVGTRTSESTSRAASIKKWRTEDKFGNHRDLTQSKTYMPIVDWTIEDVWEYLTQDKLAWSDSIPVRRLYKEATGECGLNSPKEMEEKLKLAQMESCGARFGCWLCPVITSDRSTEEMTDYHGWLEPLTEYREFQQRIYGNYKPLGYKGQPRKERSYELRRAELINHKVMKITKSGYNRKGTRMKDHQGTLTVKARKLLFDVLIDTEFKIDEMRAEEGLEYMKLISDEEIELIKKEWKNDEENNPHLLDNVNEIPLSELKPLIEDEVDERELQKYIETRVLE